MTGYLSYFKDPDSTPEHERLLFVFSEGYQLAYVCQRRLGRVFLTNSIDTFIEKKKIGPDATTIDLFDFRKLFSRGSGSVKTALMNQSGIAGLGNIYTDEILFQAGIHPKSEKSALTQNDTRNLYDSLKRVIKISIENNADTDKFPDTFIIPRRKENDPCPRCNGTIEKIRISGRGTFFCPSCQEFRGL
jgi:formamidopyrimidine-DNA glycosylase